MYKGKRQPAPNVAPTRQTDKFTYYPAHHTIRSTKGTGFESRHALKDIRVLLEEAAARNDTGMYLHSSKTLYDPMHLAPEEVMEPTGVSESIRKYVEAWSVKGAAQTTRKTRKGGFSEAMEQKTQKESEKFVDDW